MKRVLVVSFLSLAAAGCAQSRSALSKQDTPSPGVVAVTPVPSLYDTVNQGMGNPAIVRSAIKDPDSPQWSGRAPVAAATRPAGGGGASGGGASPGQGPSQIASAGGGAAAPASLATQMPANAGSGGPVQTPDAVSTPAARGVTGTPVANGLIGQPAPASLPGPEPAPVSPPGMKPVAVSEPATANAGPPSGDPVPMPSEPAAAGSPPLVGAQEGAGNAPPTSLLPAMPEAAPSGSLSPAVPAAAPSGSLSPAVPDAAPVNQERKLMADPLLGPNPELMPPMPDLSELDSRPAKAAARPTPGSAAIPPAGRASAVLSEDAAPIPLTPSVKPPAGPASAVKPTGTVPGPTAADVKMPASPAGPALPDLPEPGPAAAGPIAPAGAAAAPAVIPLELEPAPPASAGAGGASDPASQPKAAGDSAALTEPARAGSVAALPALEAAPQGSNVIKVAEAKPAAQPPDALRRDPQVVLTAAEKIDKEASPAAKPKSPSDVRRHLSLEPGRPVAKVGDDVITYHDVLTQVREHRAYRELREAFNNPATKREAMEHFDMLFQVTLNGLIDRTLLVQDAKRRIKDTKMLDQFYEQADRVFHDTEVLPLQRQYQVDTEDLLKEKLAERGRSLTQMQQSFRTMFLAEQYLHSRLNERMKVELPDLLKYYNEQLSKHDFDRPALITWREIVVEPISSTPPPSAPHDSTVLLTSQGTSREVALHEAEALLEKLRRGEDFAKLAKKESDGPAGSRNQGGLMETSPGGYGIAAVNQALESLPIGQISGVIEGPDGFHIVKVEKRRTAGPASFEEVQDQIKPRLMEAKSIAERTAFIAKLRKNTLITLYNPIPSKRSPARATLNAQTQSPKANDKLPPQNP